MTWMKARSRCGSNCTTSIASLTLPPSWRSRSLMGLILRFCSGMKVIEKRRCSLRYCTHSRAVLSLSTTTLSMWRPSSTESARLYWRLVTSARSVMRPYTPGKICFMAATASFILRSRSLSRRSARASRSLPSTSCSCLSSCSRLEPEERAASARRRRSCRFSAKLSRSFSSSSASRSFSSTVLVYSASCASTRFFSCSDSFISVSSCPSSAFWAERSSSRSCASLKDAAPASASRAANSARCSAVSWMPPELSLDAACASIALVTAAWSASILPLVRSTLSRSVPLTSKSRFPFWMRRPMRSSSPCSVTSSGLWSSMSSRIFCTFFSSSMRCLLRPACARRFSFTCPSTSATTSPFTASPSSSFSSSVAAAAVSWSMWYSFHR
mmetsp:Transcript_2185/g.5453  ORF Transcript_2185/g.5453 Transcript_2185/m.5453 type:complete len:384 (+) Transcript_2185:2093-3244(+)